MSLQYLLILIGAPGSGKSYFAERFSKNNNFEHINSDQVRQKYFSNPRFSPSEKVKVYDKMFEIVEKSLVNNKNVIFDGNLVTNKVRNDIYERFKTRSKVFFIYFNSTKEEALQRAINRTRTEDNLYKPMPEDRAKRMHDRFEEIDEKLPHIVINGFDDYKMNEKLILSKFNL